MIQFPEPTWDQTIPEKYGWGTSQLVGNIIRQHTDHIFPLLCWRGHYFLHCRHLLHKRVIGYSRPIYDEHIILGVSQKTEKRLNRI